MMITIKYHSIVYPSVFCSKINHSCFSNASKSIQSKDNNTSMATVCLYALRDISKNEEITIWYPESQDNLFLPTNQRCSFIKQQYGFDCQCVRCIHTCTHNVTDVKLKSSNKNKNKNKSANKNKSDDNKDARDAIDKVILWDKLLKGAVFPAAIQNNKSKQKYISKMKQEFDKINKLYKRNKNIATSGFSYNYETIAKDWKQLINLSNKFLTTYETVFLLSTHWRVIQMKKIDDHSMRYLCALLPFLNWGDSQNKECVTQEMLNKTICNIISEMKSEYGLLFDNLKYIVADRSICVKLAYFDA